MPYPENPLILFLRCLKTLTGILNAFSCAGYVEKNDFIRILSDGKDQFERATAGVYFLFHAGMRKAKHIVNTANPPITNMAA